MVPRSPDVVSCGAVVFRASDEGPSYLLLQYGARHWDFPKGHMESGEREEETTRRETVEETGIDDLVFLPDFRRTMRYWYTHKGQRVHKEVVFFVARTQAAPDGVRLSHEHIGYQWLPYQDAMDQLTFDNARELLRAVHQHIEKQGAAAVQ